MSNKDWSSVIPEGLSDEWKEFVVWHLNQTEKIAKKANQNFDEKTQRGYVERLLEGGSIFSEEQKEQLSGMLVELGTLIHGKPPVRLKTPDRPTGPQFPKAPQPAA